MAATPPASAFAACAAASATWLGRCPVRSADSSRATSSSVAAFAIAACAPAGAQGEGWAHAGCSALALEEAQIPFAMALDLHPCLAMLTRHMTDEADMVLKVLMRHASDAFRDRQSKAR